MTTYDFRDIDISQVDPERISLGTNLQDCSLIAKAFERGAHSTPTEAAVFATLNRMLENTKAWSSSVSGSLEGYIVSPKVSSKDQASELIASAGVEAPSGSAGGVSATMDDILKALKLDDGSELATFGASFGENLMDWARECIPCGLRLEAFLELNPNVNLLDALETDLKNRLSVLTGSLDLLKNFDVYGDFCSLLKLLNFMCVPDLQRIIATLMAMFLLEVPELDGLIDILQALVAPLFAPLFMSITTLLDQFVALIVNPLECVVAAIDQQTQKLAFSTTPATTSPDYPDHSELENLIGPENAAQVQQNLNTLAKETGLTQAKKDAIRNLRTLSKETGAAQTLASLQQNLGTLSKDLTSSLGTLSSTLQESIVAIQDRMDFYITEIKSMIGEFGFSDSAYIGLSFRKLNTIRLISFVIAMINALSKGQTVCNPDAESPTVSEIDNFFNNFLNPQSNFNMWIDDKGMIHIADDRPGEDVSILSNSGNVFQFEGEDLLDPSILETANKVTEALSSPIHVTMPCKFKTSVEDTEKVNRWVTELNNS